MSDEELTNELESLGSADVPDVDDRFADALESRLRIQGAEQLTAAPTTRPIWQPLAGVLTAAVLVIAGFVALDRLGDGNDSEILVLAVSQDATVILPGGEVVTDSAGLELPDGTRIEVGPTGSATIGGVVLESGAVAEIVDGVVEIQARPTEFALPTTGVPTTTRPSTTATSTAPASTSPPPTVGPITEPPPTTRRTTTTTASTATDRTTTTPRTTTTTITRPTRTGPDDVAVKLEVFDVSVTRARLQWSTTSFEGIADWAVRAIQGDRTSVVAVLGGADARALAVARPERGSVTYVVVARDGGGATIAESNPVTLAGR
jgi:hypothetical protein